MIVHVLLCCFKEEITQVCTYPCCEPRHAPVACSISGFRKYRTILLTLAHELTHNVHGPHNLEFKELCSRLSSEINKVSLFYIYVR